MLRILKLQIFSCLLLVFVPVLTCHSQNSTIDFLWNDQENNERTGTLVLNWNHNNSIKQWELLIDVKWQDTRGRTIADQDLMPFIYLSEYDLEVDSQKDINCLTFSMSSEIYDMQFKDKGALRFSIPDDIESPGNLKIKFSFSLSEGNIRDAKIDPIRIPGKQEIIIPLPDTTIKDIDSGIDAENTNNDSVEAVMSAELKESCQSIRNQLNSIESIWEKSNSQIGTDENSLAAIREGIDEAEPGDTLMRSRYEQSLQSYLNNAYNQIAKIDSSITYLNSIGEFIMENGIPQDSADLYIIEVNRLNTEALTLRGKYVQQRIQIRNLLGELGSTYADLQLEGLKKELEGKYGKLFKQQIDNVGLIQEKYLILEPELSDELEKGNRGAHKSGKLDELRASHEQLKADLDSIHEAHWEDYYSYREGIEQTDPISSIETLHIRFDDNYNNLNLRMNNMDMQISGLITSMNEQIIKPTPRLIIIGVGIIAFLILLIVLIRLSQRKRTESSRVVVPASPAGNGINFNLIDGTLEESAEYYKISVPNDTQDNVLSDLHLHIRVIKTVYHQIQKALIDKKPDSFGGLVFGRKYEENGNGTGHGKYTVIIERAVPAENIRPDMSASQEEGKLLVSEIDKIVAENRKSALLGWYSSARDGDIEMPENMIKVHRTYFSEKWQVSCLIYPGSELLNSGFFVRRKSGYFETTPSEELKLNWDQLYQFAVDPPAKKQLEDKKKPDPDDFLKIELNKNWSDSIVEHLYIHPDILKEISTEKDNRIQMVVGQNANGFLYGEVWNLENGDENDKLSYEVFINKFTLASGNENPRELPGAQLIGWIRFDDNEIFEALKSAIPYHEEVFKSQHQICILINTNTSEMRFFSRKHTLEMNNNTIETEEFNLSTLLSTLKT